MLINSEATRGSAIFELLVSAILIAGVSIGVYAVQHPHQTAQEQAAAAIHQ